MMQPASRVFGTPDIRYFDFIAVQGFCNVKIMAFPLQVCMKVDKVCCGPESSVRELHN